MVVSTAASAARVVMAWVAAVLVAIVGVGCAVVPLLARRGVAVGVVPAGMWPTAHRLAAL